MEDSRSFSLNLAGIPVDDNAKRFRRSDKVTLRYIAGFGDGKTVASALAFD
jgi:hypothetical protein